MSMYLKSAVVGSFDLILLRNAGKGRFENNWQKENIGFEFHRQDLQGQEEWLEHR